MQNINAKNKNAITSFTFQGPSKILKRYPPSAQVGQDLRLISYDNEGI